MDEGTAYVVGNFVWLGNAGYRCILNHTASGANQPPNVTYWVEYDMLYNAITPNGALGFNQSTNWMEVQSLYGQETTPGVSGDAYHKLWVGAPGSNSDMLSLAFDSTAAQPGPTSPAAAYPGADCSTCWRRHRRRAGGISCSIQTYGGLASQYSPPQTMYFGLNQLYASTK